MELQFLLTVITIILSGMLNNFDFSILKLSCFSFHYHCELFKAFHSLIQLIAKSIAVTFRILGFFTNYAKQQISQNVKQISVSFGYFNNRF